VFLRAGFFVGDDTPVAAIRAVPPAASLSWGDAGPVLQSGWRAPEPSTLSRANAVDAFGDAFAAAIRRALDGHANPVAVLLSGGHDSRHILLAMAEQGRVPDCGVTVHPYPPDAPDDVEIARELAAAVGVRHIVIPQRTDRIAAEREKNRLTDFCADEHAQFLPLRAHFHAAPHVVFDGLAGDVLSQSQRLDRELYDIFRNGQFEAVAERVLGVPGAIEPALAKLLTPDAFRRFDRRLAVARVAAEASRYADAPNPIAAFFFFSRTRREIALAPYGILRGIPGTAVRTPFLDPDVAGLLFSLPFATVADRTFHTEVLTRRYARYSGIRFGGKQLGPLDRGRGRRLAIDLLRLGSDRAGLVDTGAVRARAVRALVSGDSTKLWFVPRIVHLLDVASAGAQVAGRART
jgi:asparagine synthase (glutamine-hydrolysing)